MGSGACQQLTVPARLNHSVGIHPVPTNTQDFINNQHARPFVMTQEVAQLAKKRAGFDSGMLQLEHNRKMALLKV